jgi:hypothetical protein
MGIEKRIYEDNDLSHAIKTIFCNKPEMLKEIYKNTRLSSLKSSEEIGLEIINRIILNLDAFKDFISNLPSPNDMSSEEFELIVYYTFHFTYNERARLIDFIGKSPGNSNMDSKYKIDYSNLSNEIKEELNSYLIASKLTQ